MQRDLIAERAIIDAFNRITSEGLKKSQRAEKNEIIVI